jgi:segregation and condensation protein B
MKLLAQHIEALIFASESAISPEEIITCLKTVYGWELTKEDVSEAVEKIKAKYADDEFAFELNEIAGGYEFLSKKDFHAAIHVMLQLKEKKKLSTAALETLAIIAYKQPITKPELEHIRGVSCDYSIQKLLEKELIVIAGKSDGPGKALLYNTSKNFMDHFGLSSVKDLPKLKDLQSEDASSIGTPTDLLDADTDSEANETDIEVTDASAESQSIDNTIEEGDLQGEASITEDFEATAEESEEQEFHEEEMNEEEQPSHD